MKEYLSKQKDDIYIIYMRICMYLFIYRERDEERLRMIFGGTFLLPEASTYLLKYNSLQRTVLLTLIWHLSPSIVLAKVQSYLWHLPTLLSDPNIHDNSNPNHALPRLEKTFPGLYSRSKLLASTQGGEGDPTAPAVPSQIFQ